MRKVNASTEYLIAGVFWLILAKLSSGEWSLLFALCAVLALTVSLALQIRDAWRR